LISLCLFSKKQSLLGCGGAIACWGCWECDSEARPRNRFFAFRVFQTINDPNPVIASLHFVSLAMTIGHFFPWNTLNKQIVDV